MSLLFKSTNSINNYSKQDFNEFAFFNRQNITGKYKLPQINSIIEPSSLDNPEDVVIYSRDEVMPTYIASSYIAKEHTIDCSRLIDGHSGVKTSNVPYKLEELKEIAKDYNIQYGQGNKSRIVMLLRNRFCIDE